MKPQQMKIYCVGCGKSKKAELVSGRDIYPNRTDLYHLPFWRCYTCKNYVGCHHKIGDGTKPLGVIPTRELREKRRDVHRVLDPIWRRKQTSRNKIYKYLSKKLGREFHTGDIKSNEEADKIIYLLKEKYYKK